mmetsp:Transcript_2866/g.7867  ORF Transcript_2866/g.7867 Transcript_2866/m.7867 type:complete len:328 (-) Transcript_2866:1664-2647(-)
MPELDMPVDTDTDTDTEKTIRKTLASLDVQKRAMEHEADAILLELTTPPSEGIEPMGIETPLVDREGYPRADIDVYRARTLRNRFLVLKTDHKEIGENINGLLLQLARLKNPSIKKAESEEKTRRLAPKPLPKYDSVTGKWVVKNWDGSVSGVAGGDRLRFENLSQNRAAVNDTSGVASSIGSGGGSIRNGSKATTDGSGSLLDASSDGRGAPDDAPHRQPFARVDGIAKESPAEDAGMHVGDLVTRFGPLDVKNHDRLRAVAKLVPEVAGEGGTIRLLVLRFRGEQKHSGDNDYNDEATWEEIALFLRPRPFSGRGLLGCHIIPYE